MNLRKSKKGHFVVEEPLTWILYLLILIGASFAIKMIISRAAG